MSDSQVIAKHAITETLYKYCRSLDRMDSELYEVVFCDNAELKYDNYFSGTAVEFRDWVWAAHETMQAHTHQISNVLIEIEAGLDRATSESYVTVCLVEKKILDGQVRHIVERGRYLDKWVKEEAGWRIYRRQYCPDIHMIADLDSSLVHDVKRDSTDPSYLFL